MSDSMRSLRSVLRSLARSPGYAAVTVLTLGLVLGANAAMFSVLDAVLLARLPYEDPGRLYDVGVLPAPRGGEEVQRGYLDDHTFDAWRGSSATVAGLAAYLPVPVVLTGQGAPARLEGAQVDPRLFSLLGTEPALGRAAELGDDEVVLAHDLWQRRFGGDPAIVGRRLVLDGTPRTVTAVMPAAFFFPHREVEIWTPLPESAGPAAGEGAVVIGTRYLPTIARLAPAAGPEQAEAEAEAVVRGLHERGVLVGDSATADRVDLVPLADSLVAPVRPALLALGAAVALVLLVACANLAGLLLARNAARERELAVRLALGSGRGSLVRRLLGETLLLALLGGAGGWLLALWLHRLLPRWLPPGMPRVDEVALDLRVFAFAVLAALLAAALVGLVPALRAGRADLLARLSAGATDRLETVRARTVLVVAQLAVATVLLIGAGLLVRSFLALTAVEPGFQPQGVLVTRLTLDLPGGVPAPERTQFLDRLLDRLAAHPAVAGVGVAGHLPMTSRFRLTDVELPGAPAEQRTMAVVQWSSPGYPQVLGMRLRDGRWPTPREHRAAAPVAVVNRTFARRFLPGGPAVGRRIGIGSASLEVVGEAGDVRLLGPLAEAKPEVFLSYRLAPAAGEPPPRQLGLALRSQADSGAVDGVIRGAVAELAPDLAVEGVEPLEARWREAGARPRFYALLLTGFALVALVLAAAGIYATLAYSVSRSTRQIAVRRALGASRRHVLSRVLRGGLGTAALGIGLGVVLAGLASRAAAHLLFGVEAVDPVTYLAAAAVLAGVALVACLLPARRASRVDPVVALRHE